MATVDILSAKTNLAKLVARAERGEEIVITRKGKRPARLVAYEQIIDTSRRLGLVAGQYETCTQAEFDADNEKIANGWLEQSSPSR